MRRRIGVQGEDRSLRRRAAPRERSFGAAAGGTAPPATIPLLIEGEVATERGRGAVGAPAAACRRIAGSGPLHVLIFAVIVANAITLGLGTYALGRAADSAVLALEDVILSIFVS